MPSLPQRTTPRGGATRPLTAAHSGNALAIPAELRGSPAPADIDQLIRTGVVSFAAPWMNRWIGQAVRSAQRPEIQLNHSGSPSKFQEDLDRADRQADRLDSIAYVVAFLYTDLNLSAERRRALDTISDALHTNHPDCDKYGLLPLYAVPTGTMSPDESSAWMLKFPRHVELRQLVAVLCSPPHHRTEGAMTLTKDWLERIGWNTRAQEEKKRHGPLLREAVRGLGHKPPPASMASEQMLWALLDHVFPAAEPLDHGVTALRLTCHHETSTRVKTFLFRWLTTGRRLHGVTPQMLRPLLLHPDQAVRELAIGLVPTLGAPAAIVPGAPPPASQPSSAERSRARLPRPKQTARRRP